jgi:hypothetical protein
MNCEEFKKLLNDYLDGSLEESTLKELNKHKTECSECKAEFDFMQELLLATEQLNAQPPSNLRELVLEQISAEEKRTKNIFCFKRFSITFSTVAAVLVLFFISYNLLPMFSLKKSAATNQAALFDNAVAREEATNAPTNDMVGSESQKNAYTAEIAKSTSLAKKRLPYDSDIIFKLDISKTYKYEAIIEGTNISALKGDTNFVLLGEIGNSYCFKTKLFGDELKTVLTNFGFKTLNYSENSVDFYGLKSSADYGILSIVK